MYLITRLLIGKTIDLGSVVSLSWMRSEEYLEVRKKPSPTLFLTDSKVPRYFHLSLSKEWKEYAWVKHEWSINSSTEFVKQPLLKKSSWWMWFLRDSVSRVVGVPQKSKQSNQASSATGRVLHIIMRTGNVLAWGPHYIKGSECHLNWFCTSQLFAPPAWSSVSFSAG